VRFVLVSETPDRVQGGIERHAAALAKELARRGQSVDLVRPADLRRDTVRAADWLVFDGVHRLTILRHARKFGSRPGLVLIPHGSFLEEAHESELLANGRWAPTVRYRARRAFDRAFGRRVFARFDRWFVLHETEAEDVRSLFGVPRTRVSVLGLFVSDEFEAAARAVPTPPPVPGPYICSVSRIDRRKNFGALLEAIAGSTFRFMLAGQDRGGLPELEAVARRFPDARWEYLGSVSETEKVALLRGAEIVVVPSVLEGVPTVALEARALGRPVVLAGFAYGPGGAGVVRCAPRPKEIRAALESLRGAPAVPPAPAPTVGEAVDRLLAVLGEPPSPSV
jgi:glycosyltransferase involved in cell wall biosynthesis